MTDESVAKDLYSSQQYYKVIEDLATIDNLDEWSYVFLANSYAKLNMFDECADIIGEFKMKYPTSNKLKTLDEDISKKKTIFTIGYSSYPPDSIDDFVEQLKAHRIKYLIDVRTTPLSKTFSQYNCEHLSQLLKNNGLTYCSLKNEFGARRNEDAVYQDLPMELMSALCHKGKDCNLAEHTKYVDFELVYKLKTFNDGFKLCEKYSDEENICFMCSETRPWDCHRSIMVSEYFRRNGYFVKHIMGKECISQKECNEELKNFFNIIKSEYYYSTKQKTLSTFEDKDSYWDCFFNEYTLEKAIKLKNIQIGYKR